MMSYDEFELPQESHNKPLLTLVYLYVNKQFTPLTLLVSCIVDFNYFFL
jgi:hypothetical protein